MNKGARIRIALVCEIWLDGKLILTSRDGQLIFEQGVGEAHAHEALQILDQSNRVIQTAYDRLWKKFGPPPPKQEPKLWERG